MKRNVILKVVTDLCMTAMLLVLMAYELVGQSVYEWLGLFLFLFLILHHIWNRKWLGNIFKRKRPPGISSCAKSSVGIRKYNLFYLADAPCHLLSDCYDRFSDKRHNSLTPCACIFAHCRRAFFCEKPAHGFGVLGLSVFISPFGIPLEHDYGNSEKALEKMPAVPVWTLRGAAFLTAVYGTYAFMKRGIGEYMVLKNQFVFFNFDEPLIFFLIDYLAVLALFVWCGHYLSKWAKSQNTKRFLK